MTLVLAMLLDALLGEPRWLWSRFPHPAVVMGRAIGFIDKAFNRGDHRRLAGALSFGGTVGFTYALGWLIVTIPGVWADVILGAILLAQRSLCAHVSAVADGLRMSLLQGRRSVAMIVSRDTGDMDQSAVARSAIESGAENLSDGVIAPVFWFALLGLPGLMAYKVTNTADSMIGYRNPRYAAFGWAAARFDDLLNWVPARLTALLIWITAPHIALRDIAQDAALHRSPNAGWPEAAVAHKLGFALAGPRSYDGQRTDDPYVNPQGKRDLDAGDIDRTVAVLWQAWLLTLLAALLIAAV